MVEAAAKGNEETGIYLAPEQITPLDKPEEAWNKCVEDIKCTSNWALQFEACNIARRICAHHTHILATNPIQLHTLVLGLLKVVDSLRSSLAKNGLILLTGM